MATSAVVAVLCFLVSSSHAVFLRSSPQQEKHTVQVAHFTNSTNVTLLGPGQSLQAPLLLNAQQPVTNAPQMFVAVLTTRSTSVEKRNAIRNLWREVDGGSGHICARFVVCEAFDAHRENLQKEQTTYGDMLTLPCMEGYAQGLLTKKVIAAVRAFRQAAGGKDPCLDRPLFMKMDDDTFVAGHRFRQGLQMAVQSFGADYMYAGVDLPGQPPSRDATSPWYEPLQTWPYTNYPPAMYGGPGYILGRSMVHQLIDQGIADAHVLWNEDRAVGVWVHVLEGRGVKVNWIRIPGTNGFFWDKPVKGGSWGAYPYTLHHHLGKACIYCMTQVDLNNDPNAMLEPCFQQDTKTGTPR